MLNINRADVEQIVKIIEYILDNQDKVSVDKLLQDNGITFEEYRLVSALAMPAIRWKNKLCNMRQKAAYYKGVYVKEKNDRESVDEVLRMAKDYLDRRFAQKPTVVIKTAEQEAAERGNDNDFAGDDEEPDYADR